MNTPLIGFVGGLFVGAVIALALTAAKLGPVIEMMDAEIHENSNWLNSLSKLMRCSLVRDAGHIEVATCPQCQGQVMSAKLPFLYSGHQN